MAQAEYVLNDKCISFYYNVNTDSDSWRNSYKYHMQFTMGIFNTAEASYMGCENIHKILLLLYNELLDVEVNPLRSYLTAGMEATRKLECTAMIDSQYSKFPNLVLKTSDYLPPLCSGTEDWPNSRGVCSAAGNRYEYYKADSSSDSLETIPDTCIVEWLWEARLFWYEPLAIPHLNHVSTDVVLNFNYRQTSRSGLVSSWSQVLSLEWWCNWSSDYVSVIKKYIAH